MAFSKKYQILLFLLFRMQSPRLAFTRQWENVHHFQPLLVYLWLPTLLAMGFTNREQFHPFHRLPQLYVVRLAVIH